MPTLAQAQAAQLLLDRRQIRASLEKFSCSVLPEGQTPALHHKLIIHKLEAVVRKEIKRLAIFLPPGSAKSTYSSIHFPPWYLAQDVNKAILSCSHTADLSESFGRRCRNLVSEHSKVLGYELTAHSQAAGRWETTTGGGYLSAGVGGKIAGRRADLGLIDDPIGSKEQANSKDERDKIWDWYKFDFRPRLKPEAAVVLIQTRWHEDDLAGRLLNSQGAGEWEVISLPMIAEENDALGRSVGDLLWPEYYTNEMVKEAKEDTTLFNSLYQQNPTPESGNFFAREFIKTYLPGELPKDLRIYCASDHAVSERQEADFSCFMKVGVDSQGNIWVLDDLVWDRLTSDKAVAAMIAMVKRDRPVMWYAEKGHISKSIGPFLNQAMQDSETYFAIDEVTPARDKQTRAGAINGRLRQGKVFFPSTATWWPKALAEMLTFPKGTHDDFVDALSHIGMAMDRLGKASVPAPVTVETAPQRKDLTFGWLKKSDKARRHNLHLAMQDN